MKKLTKKQIAKLINDPKRIDAIANEFHMVKWEKCNPWFGYDKKLTHKAIKIARELDNKGINGKTNKYWDMIKWNEYENLYISECALEKLQSSNENLVLIKSKREFNGSIK